MCNPVDNDSSICTDCRNVGHRRRFCCNMVVNRINQTKGFINGNVIFVECYLGDEQEQQNEPQKWNVKLNLMKAIV